jgi:GNAT superfamily N-acetyltransferase
MTDSTIEELTTDEEFIEAFPVMNQLRTDLDESTYLERLRSAQSTGYRLFALREHDDIIALAGIVIRTNLFDGKLLWVDDLVTARDYRSQGFGQQLLEYIAQWGSERDCDVMGLASGFQRSDAHRFYEERLGMEATSYVYRMDLE